MGGALILMLGVFLLRGGIAIVDLIVEYFFFLSGECN